jgi:hypothetical protein
MAWRAFVRLNTPQKAFLIICVAFGLTWVTLYTSTFVLWSTCPTAGGASEAGCKRLGFVRVGLSDIETAGGEQLADVLSDVAVLRNSSSVLVGKTNDKNPAGHNEGHSSAYAGNI